MTATWELDHVFVCSDVGAPAAARLMALGLVEGSGNIHPGQGTACRRFFFHNAMLELLWVRDPIEACCRNIDRTGLWRRWSGRRGGACPFGLCTRPASGRAALPPFASWDYRPPYLPEPRVIAMGLNSPQVGEPLLFHLGFGRRPDAVAREPLAHSAGLRELTRITIATPQTQEPSPELRTLLAAGLLRLERASAYLMTLSFDGEGAAAGADLRPDLPLMLRW